jgi:cell shape-determining protein MreC
MIALVILIALGLLLFALYLYVKLSKSPKVDKVIHDLTDEVDFLEKTPEQLIQEKTEAIQNIQDKVEKNKSEIDKKKQDVEKMKNSIGEKKGKESADDEEVVGEK